LQVGHDRPEILEDARHALGQPLGIEMADPDRQAERDGEGAEAM
jgi:hypothetical protein